MKRVVSAFALLQSPSRISLHIGEAILYAVSHQMELAARAGRSGYVVPCLITYDDGKPARRKRRARR